MASSIGGLRTPNGAAAPRLRQDIEDLAADVDLVSTPVFASTTARDGAYAAAIAAGEFGMRCYITNRAGYSRYRHIGGGTKAWRWEPECDLLFDGTRASAADALGTGASVSIVLAPTLTLPVGNRLIEISASANVTNIAGAGTTTTGRAYISGIADGDNYLQSAPLAGTVTATVNFYRKYVRSGTMDFDLRGLSATAGNPVRFTNSWLQIVDLGPVG